MASSSSSSSDDSTKTNQLSTTAEQHTKLISELKPNEIGWTSKLIVAAKQSPKKGQTPERMHQTMTLIDTKINKIRGIIFNRDVDSLKHKLELGKTYMISNALIQEEKLQYKTPGTDLSLTFRQGMPIEELDEDNTPLIESLYTFTPVNECANYLGTTSDLNVCGIVLHVFEKQQINSASVQNVLIIDDSMAVMRISMWGNFADSECLAISAISKTRPIIAVVNLRIGTHKESVTMTTKTNSCFFINPDFKIAKKLKEWRDANMPLLNKLANDQQSTPYIQIIPTPKFASVKTLAHFITTAKNATIHGNIWVKAKFRITNFDQPFNYIGCKDCKKATPTTNGMSFACYGCNGRIAKATPCLRIEVLLRDGGDSTEAVMFEASAQKLFKCNASDVHKLIEQGANRNLLKTIFKSDKKTYKIFYIHHNPSNASNSQQQRHVINQVYDIEQLQTEGKVANTSEAEITLQSNTLAHANTSTNESQTDDQTEKETENIESTQIAVLPPAITVKHEKPEPSKEGVENTKRARTK